MFMEITYNTGEMEACEDKNEAVNDIADGNKVNIYMLGKLGKALLGDFIVVEATPYELYSSLGLI